MERNSIIGMVVAMIVVIAGISVITIPMISEMTDNIHSTAINEAVRYSLAETDDRVEMEIINGIGYINDDTIKDEFGYRMMMFSDTFVVIYDVANEPNSNISLYSVSESTGTVYTVKSIVAEKGAWTATTANNATISGTYNWLMAWNKHGNYGAAISGQINQPLYVNADATIYTCGAGSATSISLKSGTVNNLRDIISVGTAPEQTITSEQYTTEPNVIAITGFTSDISPSSIFVPIKYDTFTSFDQILKTMVEMAPVLIGLMFLAAVGFYMTRNLKM